MSTAPAKKRVRSEAQLVQKRAVDRVKHKQNRQEEKRRVERIETDIAQIKQALQDIATQLCVQPPASAVQTTTQGGTDDQMLVAADDLRAWQLTSLGSQSTGGLFTLPEELQRQVSGLGAPSLPQSVPEARSWVHPVQLPVPRIVNCRCGLRHSDQFNSLDNCNITTLYQGHIATAQDLNLGISLPRNPSLAAMMLHSQDENPAVNFITPFLRDCKGGKNVETLLGSYFIGYRLMRVFKLLPLFPA